MNIKILLLLSLVFLLTACSTNQSDTKKSEHTKYYLGIIKSDSSYVQRNAEKTKEIQLAHRANIGRLADLGLMALAGPF